MPFGTWLFFGYDAENCAKRQKMLRKQHDTAERRKSFSPSFLYFTKRRKKGRQGRQKDLIGMHEFVVLGALIRGLQNLESPFGKVLIMFVGS